MTDEPTMTDEQIIAAAATPAEAVAAEHALDATASPAGAAEATVAETAYHESPGVSFDDVQTTDESGNELDHDSDTEPLPLEVPLKTKKTSKKTAPAEEIGVPDEDEDGNEPSPEPLVESIPVVLAPPVPESARRWYVVKVVSGREQSIKEAIERKIRIEGLEPFFGQIVIPVERVTEVKKVKESKNGEKVTKEKRVVKERKKYPGYLMAEVEFNDQILYVFRETNGVGDFVGATGPLKPPPPMSDREVAVMLGTELSEKDGGKVDGRKTKVKVKIDLEKGDKVRLRDGAFAGTEGEVMEITEAKDDTDTPKITVEVQFWGRPVKIDNLEYWQVDKV